jgi:hypothetical protein
LQFFFTPRNEILQKQQDNKALAVEMDLTESLPMLDGVELSNAFMLIS